MKKVIKKSIQSILPLILGVFILYWVYKDFDFSRVSTVFFHQMNHWWMALSLVAGILSHVIRGIRWKQTLAPLGLYPKTSNCINSIFISYFSNLLIPRIGEVSRCGVLAKYDHIPFAKSLGTVITERAVDTLCVAIITVLAFLLQADLFFAFFSKTGISMATIYNLLYSPHFYIVMLCIAATLILLYYLLRTRSFFEKIKGVVFNVWEGILSLKDVQNKPLFVFYTVLIWANYFLQFYLAFFCFEFTDSLSLNAALVLFVAGSIAMVVPTPNGTGPWHFAIISMMVLYGVDEHNAGIFALITHGIQTLLIIGLGIYAFRTLAIQHKKSAQ